MEPTKIMDDFDRELAEASGQRTKVWRDVRAGKFTASEIYKLMGDPKSKEAKAAGEWADGAITYINQKVAEEITGFVHESASAAAIEWGIDLEPVAKEHFTKVTGKQVSYAGFKIYNEQAGGSPDGFVDDFLLEIKCPYNSGNHVEYMKLKKGIELQTEFPEHWYQIQSNLLFNDSPMCYFVSFDPRFPDKQKMKIVEVYALKSDQDRIVERINKAIKTKAELINQITQ